MYELIKNLQRPELFPHPVSEFNVYETHSSVVLTTGDYVYKIKKAVNFGFLDYSTLEKRYYHCQREIELNRTLAPDIYLEVVPLYGDNQHPNLKHNGSIFEYAVKMRQFPQKNIFSELLADRNLTEEIINKLAAAIADFHRKIPIAEKNVAYGNAEHIHQFAMDNFAALKNLLSHPDDLAEIKTLEQATQACYQRIKSALQQRKDQGFVRHCHGDMHLNNIVLINDAPVIFDCIEFNEDFIWTDVMGDLGFILMDLDEHHSPALSHSLLNRYLEITGDYSALTVLPYFCAYRAMVRAKVDQIRLSQPDLDDAERQTIWQHYHASIKLVKKYFAPTDPKLLIMHGFIGSGKSTVAQLLVKERGAIHIRSDIERKRLAELEFTAKSNSGLYDDLYKPEITNTVYQHLAQLATQIIHAGYTAIVDATFIRHDLRQQFLLLAKKLNVPFKILDCTAPAAKMRAWITQRSQRDDNVSEGNLEILDHQLHNHDPLTADELKYTLTIHTAELNDQQHLLKSL